MNLPGTRPGSPRVIRAEDISCNPWNGEVPLDRILLIRLQAIGDIAITLPACTALRRLLPDARIDFLAGEASRGLPGALTIFDTVHVFPEVHSRWERGVQTMKLGIALTKMQYDLVIDLQRNWVTRAIRRMCLPHFWSEFDRFSPTPAGVRAQETFVSAGFTELTPEYLLPLEDSLMIAARGRLLALGWDGDTPLVCLNPAGLWKTRKWPIEHYARLALSLLGRMKVTFILLGDDRIARSGELLAERIGGNTLNLIGETTLAEAFAIVQLLSVIVSDDSGLMHMAWNSGIPAIALLGSTRHEWSSPQAPHCRTFHSGDLECGACMQPECVYGDVHCLTRYTPETVLPSVLELLGGATRRRSRQ